MKKILLLLLFIVASCGKDECVETKTLVFARGYATLTITEMTHPDYWNKIVGDTIRGYEIIDGKEHPHIIQHVVEAFDCE